MKKKESTAPLVIGWREYIDLPEWGVTRMRAKIDTGARTSAIHVEDIDRGSSPCPSFYSQAK